jgi:hypothetical protein
VCECCNRCWWRCDITAHDISSSLEVRPCQHTPLHTLGGGGGGGQRVQSVHAFNSMHASILVVFLSRATDGRSPWPWPSIAALEVGLASHGHINQASAVLQVALHFLTSTRTRVMRAFSTQQIFTTHKDGAGTQHPQGLRVAQTRTSCLKRTRKHRGPSAGSVCWLDRD